MANLYILKPFNVPKQATHLAYYIKRGPLVGLIKKKNDTLGKIGVLIKTYSHYY